MRQAKGMDRHMTELTEDYGNCRVKVQITPNPHNLGLWRMSGKGVDASTKSLADLTVTVWDKEGEILYHDLLLIEDLDTPLTYIALQYSIKYNRAQKES